MAQSAGFLETFDSAPPTPADYTNPHNWDFMVFGVNEREPSLAQHGPNCEAPGFPYSSTNSHHIANAGNAVFQCNNHLMTSPGITGYGAVYMTPPAVADFSTGATTISWDQSTLRTSSRDWVYITLTPFMEHHEMPYLNVDQHIPDHNIRILLGGANTFIVSERVNGQDVNVGQQDSFHTWQDVFHAQTPPLEESPTRRDTFQITLSQNTISFCMPQYKGFNGDPTFCWARNVTLPQALSPSVWNNQATVQITHVVYNAEKACEDGALANGFDANTVLDQFNIVHNAYGDANCPPNTWHWDNVSINPAVGYSVIQSSPQDFHTNTGSPTTVPFAQPAPAGSYLSFVSWGDTPQLAVSFDNGASWSAPHFQASTALAHPEVGENVFMPIPTGQRSIMVRGANGYWGTFEAQAFKIVSPPSGSPSTAPPAATPTSTPATAPTATAVPTAGPAAPPPASVPPSGTTNCPCTVFAPSAAPSTTTGNDTNSVETGVKFRADTNGLVTGVRFYKLPVNTGTHSGSLWTSTGTLLATATFAGETASGWQQVNFSSPVAISANTSYVVSYHSQGHYAADQNYFANGVDRGPLHVLANGVDGASSLYSYSQSTTMPTNSWNASNYWVDVVYTGGSNATPPTATPVTPPAATPVPTAAAPTPTSVPAANGLTMFAANAAPASISTTGGDTKSVEVGVKFRADTNGQVTGVRFYKLGVNTGTHTGSLWTSTGTLLATATFTGESASGWQQVNFSTPVAITANTIYVVSYHTNGRYAADQNFFATRGVDQGPLHALANGVSGGNGVYTYGSSTAFPTSSYQSSNYWVDVVYSSGP